jgi:hypothetical protein
MGGILDVGHLRELVVGQIAANDQDFDLLNMQTKERKIILN